MTAYWLERAWLPTGMADGVVVVVEDGQFSSVQAGLAPGDANRLAGLTIPGLANCHSHAFHRALRGRTQRERGTFWTWREQMYDLAERLDPDSYFELAVAVYSEMLASGVTSVGEFHYLHHGPGGTPYADPNAMGNALVAAADQVGLTIQLLDTCYLAAGIGREPEGVQRRFSDGDAEAWAARVEPTGFGSAIHSVRAVPREQLPVVAGRPGPLHVHLSEQVAENDECAAAYGLSPTQVLLEAGALSERTSVVHATHLTGRDVRLIGESGAYSCFCPTTERDLADGIGPSRKLHEAGSPLTLGSDSHAVIDLFEEMRAVELDERLATGRRGHWTAAELLDSGTVNGQASLGFDAGRITVGARADLVTLDTRSPRTAGTGSDEQTVVYGASAADVVSVVSSGVQRELDHGKIGADLDRTIRRVWSES